MGEVDLKILKMEGGGGDVVYSKVILSVKLPAENATKILEENL